MNSERNDEFEVIDFNDELEQNNSAVGQDEQDDSLVEVDLEATASQVIQEEAGQKEEKKEKNSKKKSGSDEKRPLWRELLSWIITFAVAIVAALLLKNFVIINANVPTGSMQNTIQINDNLFGNRLAYTWSEPERGDIIIFKYPDVESQKYIKRVIGLPGEKVTIIDGQIFINDSETPLQEGYLKEAWVLNDGPYEFQVPENSYLVLGDNRNNSRDARFWNNTYVTDEQIIGKALFIYYPFSHMGILE